MRPPFHISLSFGLLSIGIFSPVAHSLAPARKSAVPSKLATPPRSDLAARAESVLRKNCYACHGEGKQSGLDLRTMTSLLKGGSRGATLVPGNADGSLLYRVVTHRAAPYMPPGGALSPQEIAALKAWIEKGIVKPKTSPGGSARSSLPDFWPAHPPKAVSPPKVKRAAWVKTPLDAFVLSGLEKAGLSPSPPADRRTLIRRAYFDLIGLPPKPEEVEAFLADQSPDAFAKVVDRLLALPQYGERWGRHWLDLVRYAETNGYERDNPKANAWKYRDYVIDAFNADKPFDRFLTEQLAGDEMDGATNETRIATGYYRLGLWDDEPGDHLLDRYDQLDDTIRTTTNVFLGLTVNCARCHDHKFDPISQKDYTKLLAFFEPGQLGTEPYPNGQHKQEQNQIPLADPTEVEKHRQATEAADARIAEAKKALDSFREGVKNRIVGERKAMLSEVEQAALDTPSDKRTDEQKALADKAAKAVAPADEEIDKGATSEEAPKLADLLSKLKEAEVSKPPPLPTALGMTDVGPDGPKTRLFRRGNPRDPAEETQPDFPSVFSAVYHPQVKAPPPGSRTTTRRLQLARWLADPRNPQTARVLVNRVWQHHFGEGIVRTPNDFGNMGDRPTHPELLDWLAVDFMRHGWTLKRLHRMILLSSTWQQSSRWRADAAKDPENKLLWRMNYRRLEAEPLRDSILAMSGKLNLQRGGPSVYPKLTGEEIVAAAGGSGWGESPEDQADRRTVYVFVKRSLAVPMLEAFDAADNVSVCPRRNVTTVAPQALALMNDPFVREQATHFAERLRKEAGTERAKQIDLAFQLALDRAPSEAERTRALNFLRRQERLAAPAKSSPGAPVGDPLVDFCQALYNLDEFVYVD